jgi:hypothetical protein
MKWRGGGERNWGGEETLNKRIDVPPIYNDDGVGKSGGYFLLFSTKSLIKNSILSTTRPATPPKARK